MYVGAKMKYIDIQNEIINKYRIDICDGTKCANDWARTHAHPRQRRVCKWIQSNSLESTFTLFHEIGHIVNNKSTMRRCEEEYYATVWAVGTLYNVYNIKVPNKLIDSYQRYISRELDRGLRRNGFGYNEDELNLIKHTEDLYNGK